ncbi:unnamed protein product, partial [Vitis vinifera]
MNLLFLVAFLGSTLPSPQQLGPSQPHNGIDCCTAVGCTRSDCQFFHRSCVGKCLPVEFNELGQPIGANARILARSIGDISCNWEVCPHLQH